MGLIQIDFLDVISSSNMLNSHGDVLFDRRLEPEKLALVKDRVYSFVSELYRRRDIIGDRKGRSETRALNPVKRDEAGSPVDFLVLNQKVGILSSGSNKLGTHAGIIGRQGAFFEARPVKPN